MTEIPALASRSNPRKLRLLPLVAATYFMVSGGPYGLEDIIGMAGFRWALLLLFAVPFFWSLPTAMMVGELASAIPDEGGFYAWVTRAMGRFWGFQEAWLSLAASIFDMAIYPTTLALYLTHVMPSIATGHRALMIKLAVVVFAATCNLFGAVVVGEGSLWGMVISLSPFAILIGAAVVKISHGGLHLAPGAGLPARDLASALAVCMWNYMGWDNASTIAQEVDNPQRNYPRAMFASALTCMCVYMLPLLAVWAVGIPADRFSTGAWADAATLLAGPALAAAVAMAGAFDGVGTFNALTLTLTRLPYAMAENGLLPKILTLRTKKGVPWVSVILCAVAWSLAFGLSFERLISTDLVLYGGALLLEFVALVVLRRKEPNLERPFRVPGGLLGACLVGVGPAVLLGFAIVNARHDKMGPMPALLASLLIAVAGAVVYAFYAWVRPTEKANAA